MKITLSSYRKDYYCILIIVMVAALLRLWYFADYKETSVFPILSSSDSASYYNWARDIASGRLLGTKAFMKWPLYAYVLAFLLKVCGNSLAVIYHFQFILGVLHCLVIYCIGRKLFNRRVGLIAALLCAAYGLFIFFESLLIYTSLSLLLNGFLFLYLLYIRQNLTSRNVFWLGILLGVCTIAQGNALIFGTLALAAITAGKKYRRRSIVICWGWFLLGLYIVMASVTALNWRAEKDFVPIAGNLGINFYLGNNEAASGTFPLYNSIGLNQENMFRDAAIIARQSIGSDAKTSAISYFWLKKGLHFMRRQPAAFSWLFIKKLFYALSPEEFIHDIEYHFIAAKIGIFKFLPLQLWFIYPFALTGLIGGLRYWRKFLFLYLAVGAYAFSVAVFFVTARYRLTVVPWCILFAAYGAYVVYCNLREKRYVQTAFLLPAMIGLTLSLQFFNVRLAPPAEDSAFEQYIYRASYWEHSGDYKKALQYTQKAAMIHSGNEHVAFRHAVACYRLHDTGCAEAYFKKVLAINPLQTDAYYNLGVLYNQGGDYARARKVLIAASRLDPQNPRILFELGFMYKQTGEPRKARDAFDKALQALPAWQGAQRLQVQMQLQELK